MSRQVFKVFFLKEMKERIGTPPIPSGQTRFVTKDGLAKLLKEPDLVVIQSSMTWNDESPPKNLPEILNVE